MHDNLEDAERPLGPLDYMIVEFPGSRFNGAIMPSLVELVDRGLIRILDMLVVRKTPDGDVVSMELADLERDELDAIPPLVSCFQGLLADDDAAAIGEQLQTGATAGVVVWENLWAAPLADAILRSGGEVIAAGRLDVSDVHTSLLAAEELDADFDRRDA